MPWYRIVFVSIDFYQFTFQDTKFHSRAFLSFLNQIIVVLNIVIVDGKVCEQNFARNCGDWCDLDICTEKVDIKVIVFFSGLSGDLCCTCLSSLFLTGNPSLFNLRQYFVSDTINLLT